MATATKKTTTTKAQAPEETLEEKIARQAAYRKEHGLIKVFAAAGNNEPTNVTPQTYTDSRDGKEKTRGTRSLLVRLMKVDDDNQAAKDLSAEQGNTNGYAWVSAFDTADGESAFAGVLKGENLGFDARVVRSTDPKTGKEGVFINIVGNVYNNHFTNSKSKAQKASAPAAK